MIAISMGLMLQGLKGLIEVGVALILGLRRRSGKEVGKKVEDLQEQEPQKEKQKDRDDAGEEHVKERGAALGDLLQKQEKLGDLHYQNNICSGKPWSCMPSSITPSWWWWR